MLYLKQKLNPVSKLKTFWDSLSESTTVSKRELVLGLSTCLLSGMVIGMLCSPRKTMTIGSHNGCNNAGIAGTVSRPSEEKAEDEE